MRWGIWLLAVAVVVPRQADPLKQTFLEDPQFPIQALFGQTHDRREWAVRVDDSTLVEVLNLHDAVETARRMGARGPEAWANQSLTRWLAR